MKASLKLESLRRPENGSAPSNFLVNLPEHLLLKFIVLTMDKENPAVDHRLVLADVIKKSAKHIDNVLNGITFLSFQEWFAIQDASKTTLLTEWMCLNYPQKHCCSCHHKEDPCQTRSK